MTDAESLARLFHETYERLAPQYGYETREDTKEFDAESPNGKLMIAVCGEVSARRRLLGGCMTNFEDELSELINKYSLERESNTPDFILAQYLCSCLQTFNTAVQQRETWCGRARLSESQGEEAPPPKIRPYTPREAVEFLGRAMIFSKYPKGTYALVEVGLKHALVAGDMGYETYEALAEHFTWADTGEKCGVVEKEDICIPKP